MSLYAKLLARRYAALPRSAKALIVVAALAVLFLQAEDLGEKLGKALYHVTH